MNRTLNRLNKKIEDVKTGQQHDVTDLTNDILYLMSQGYDLSSLAGNLIQLLPTHNLALKKTICLFLIKYSENIADISILTTNSLQKDFEDPNPQVRKLVLRTVCSVSSLRDLSFELLSKALVDSSLLVKQAAIACCSKVITVNNDESSEIIEKLYALIRNDDPLIVTNALVSLEDVLKTEGGVVIPYKMARYLLNRLVSFPEFCIATVCEILKKYKIKNEDETIEFLNILDPLLNNEKPLVILSILDLILSFIHKFNQNLEKDVFERVEKVLFRTLNSSCPEMSFVIMEQLENLISKHKDIFSRHYKKFFCGIKDPAYLKVKKLSILPLLLQNNNCNDITEEVIIYLKSHKIVSKQAVSSFVKILEFENELSPKHTELITVIFTSDSCALFENMLISLTSLNLQKFDLAKSSLLLSISEHYSKISSDDAKIALLSILNDYGQNIEKAPYILEELSKDQNNLNNEIVHNSLLMTSVRILLCRPAEMQLVFGKILENSMQSQHILLREQSVFYYNLLKTDIQLAAKILDINLQKET